MSCLNLIVCFQSIKSVPPLPPLHPLPLKIFPDIVLVVVYLILFLN